MSTFNIFQLGIELKFIILEVNRVMNRVNASAWQIATESRYQLDIM